jgi:hypothetical protein
MDGFFADPAYGGNQNLIGWKLVGFPGVAANYADAIGRHNQLYQVEPVAMNSLQQADLSTGPHGHPMHRHANADESRTTIAPHIAHAATKRLMRGARDNASSCEPHRVWQPNHCQGPDRKNERSRPLEDGCLHGGNHGHQTEAC